MTSAVVQWVAAHSEVPTYRAGEDFNKPGVDYATVDLSIIEDTHENHDTETWTVDEDSAAIGRRFEEELVFSVNVFAAEPLAIMAKVKAAARAEETFIVTDGGITIIESGPINQLREMENSRYADRAQMNLTARVHVIETRATEIIEEVVPITIGSPD